jgi:DNA-binding SARP family transcriptional activator/tRNA A-37 threonylcarbamoyl transferase component Bud32
VEFAILGPLEVRTADGRLRLGGPRQRAVLAHLILRANLVVPAEQLIDELWGEEPPETARNTLQTYVYRLRRVLGEDRLERRSGGYVLLAEADEIDASRFESLVREARGTLQSDPDVAVDRLDEALALWRGPAFSDFPDEPSLRGEIARLEDLRLVATEHRIAAQLALGRHTTVVGVLEALTDRHPLRERLWAGLMLSLYRTGRQAEALDAYRRAREVLSDELGIDPSPELQQLHERILRQAPELMVQPTSPRPTSAQRTGAGELASGTEFAGYRIESVIGRGGMSVVYLAQHLGLERRVALKVLAPQLAEDERFRERFVRESRIAAGMEHPNIVPIYEAGEVEGLLFIAMRYVPGTDLGKLLQREGTLAPTRTLAIVREVASALDAAHARGLVHRDVKPGNILVVEGEGADGRDLVYLSDFGLTKRLESGTAGLTQTGQFVGTVDYVAPEQIEGKGVDSRADVYSLACVAFECLTGGVPYERDSHVATLYAHLREKPPRVTSSTPDLPASLDGVLARALSKPPAQRYPTCGAFVTAARDTIGVSERAAETPARGSWPRWQSAASALGAALVAGLIVFLVSRGDTPAAERAQRPSTPLASPTPSPSPQPNFRTVERPLVADEERLLTYLPEDVGADCLPLDREEAAQGELAALVCRTAEVEVLYELFPNRDLMNAAFQINANINRAPDGECATDPLAVTPYTIDGESAGRVLCYTMALSEGPSQFGGPKKQTSHLEWTDENSAIYAHAIRNDLGDLTLYEWWLTSSGPLTSAEGATAEAIKDRPTAAARPRLLDGSYLVGGPQGCHGMSYATCALHLEDGTYEVTLLDNPPETGSVVVQKANAIIFTPRAGYCGGEGGSTRPAVYEWSADEDSVRFDPVSGGCAGPQRLARRPWTRAPAGQIALESAGEIAFMEPGGFDVEPFVADPPSRPNVSPVWSPDGRRIAFASADAEGFDLYVANADGSGLTRLTDVPGDETDPSWSPDGSRIAFAFDDLGAPEYRSGVAVVEADGSGWVELVTRESEAVHRPIWSPDGSRIGFVVLAEEEHQIYVMDADGSGQRMVHDESAVVVQTPISWTPDGRRIVFWGRERGEEMLLSMRPDGSDVRVFAAELGIGPFEDCPGCLMEESLGPLILDWSPDADWIVMGAVRPDEGELAIYLMRADGSEVFYVGGGSEPDWRPEIT